MKSIDEKENPIILNVKIRPEVKNNPRIIMNYIKDIDETYLKVLFFMYCYDNQHGFDVNYLLDAVSGENKIDIEKITEILDFWRNKRILEYSLDNSDRIVGARNYTEAVNTNLYSIAHGIDIIKSRNKNMTQPIDEISEALETKEDFRRLIDDVQIRFHSIFNPTDIGIIYNLYEINKVDVHLLLKLADICVLEEKDNVRYLEKIAIGLSSNGILTVEDYEKNYNEILKIKELEEKILRIFKMQDRKFTPQEKSFIRRWALEFDFSDDIIEEGYNICMERLFELNFRYINGIFSNWYSKGFNMLEDIKSEFNHAKGFRATQAKTSSFNIDLFFEKAVQKAMINYDD